MILQTNINFKEEDKIFDNTKEQNIKKKLSKKKSFINQKDILMTIEKEPLITMDNVENDAKIENKTFHKGKLARLKYKVRFL